MAKVLNQINVGSDILNIASTAYATCTTAAATAAKVATIEGTDGTTASFTLGKGITIHVKFTNANSAATPTLNVNGTGGKAIKRYGTTAPGTANTSSWYAGEVVTLTYDGSYWQMNKTVDNDSDTKTSSGVTSNLIYLVGAPTQSTSGHTTYSHNEVYVNADHFLTDTVGIRVGASTTNCTELTDEQLKIVNGTDITTITLPTESGNFNLATQEWVEDKILNTDCVSTDLDFFYYLYEQY